MFMTSKETHEMSPSEKLLRHDDASPDAFCFRRHVEVPIASEYRVTSQSNTAPQWAGLNPTSVGTVLGPLDHNSSNMFRERQASYGAVWTVGGLAPSGTAVDNGRGQLMAAGTNAQFFRTSFTTAKQKAEEEMEKHEARLATALGLDRVQRIVDVVKGAHKRESPRKVPKDVLTPSKTSWSGTEWVNDSPVFHQPKRPETRILPAGPFRVLDAPNLRDDFYCSILSYSPTCKTLAVGLGDLLYGWSEAEGVRLLNGGSGDDAHLTSVAFSSVQGGKCILAFGRSDRTLGLMSLNDVPDPAEADLSLLPRFEAVQPTSVSCLSWRPTCTLRTSVSPSNHYPNALVKTEDLLVGDETGHVYYYAVEWPERWEVERFNWPGVMTLKVRISIHSQQVCGLAWSPNGDHFATGGNDNICCLFETAKVLKPDRRRQRDSRGLDVENRSRRGVENESTSSHPETISEESTTFSDGTQIRTSRTSTSAIKNIKRGGEKHRWLHGAAVKAIAFCPWQEGLVATGGGSNDKCIHFFHTTTGAALATIAVSAQVTSLIWSTTRREIAATFGYAQPEHPVRIAVFSWPNCHQVAAIPWTGEHRALYAIAYPGGPGGPGEGRHASVRNHSRTATDGCIVVAASDRSVKFHEVWSTKKKSAVGGAGMLGGSDILDGLQGIDKEGDVIR